MMQRSFQLAIAAVALTAAMLQAFVSASATVRILDDGAIHNLNSAVAEEDVKVHNTTTVNLLTGGTISGLLSADYDSTVNVSGTGFNFAYGVYFDDDSLDTETLTGFLADGTAISNYVDIQDSATRSRWPLPLVAVP